MNALFKCCLASLSGLCFLLPKLAGSSWAAGPGESEPSLLESIWSGILSVWFFEIKLFKGHSITGGKLIVTRIIESSLRFRIDELLRQAGIVIAFPQRDVHLDSQAPLAVRLVES